MGLVHCSLHKVHPVSAKLFEADKPILPARDRDSEKLVRCWLYNILDLWSYHSMLGFKKLFN